MHRTAKYFIIFTPKCFVLAVADVSAELRAILLKKSAQFYNFCVVLLILCNMANSVQNSVHAKSQNSDISIPLHEVNEGKSSWIALLANLHRLQHSSVSQLLKHQLSTETAR